MKKRILIYLTALMLLLTGCSAVQSEDIPNINILTMTYNYDFVEKKYPDYEMPIRNSMNSWSEMYNEIYKITNSYRTEQGIEILTYSEDLAIIAGIRACEIAESEELSHQRPSGLKFSSLLEEYGFDTSKDMAENIGWQYETAEEICNAWKESSTHYHAIINPEYTQIGIGISINSSGELVFVEEFM